MLQQTTVATVGPYFDRFVARWPDISALAAASLDEILHMWQGLGYYARARNLHACARVVVERHGGAFPSEPAALRALPGIGDYTAAAIAAIAFDRRDAAVDGNVERVVARLYAVAEPMPAAKPRLQSARRGAGSGAAGGRLRAGDDGSRCDDLHAAPAALRALPVAGGVPAHARAGRRGAAGAGGKARAAAALRRRVLADARRRRGAAAPPPGKGSARRHDRDPLHPVARDTVDLRRSDRLRLPAAAAEWSALPGSVRHGFTHFQLELAVVAGHGDRRRIMEPDR